MWMMKTIAFPLLAAAGLLWSQQATAPPRPPVVPFTAAEVAAIPLVPQHKGKTVKKTLFDGKTLNGWNGSPDYWSVADGAIVGKSTGRIPTTFLFTKDNYTDFRLTLSSKMVESENHAGVAFWGQVLEEGANKWNTRGPLVIFPIPSMWDYIEARALRVYYLTEEKVTSQHEWIKVEILAQGNRVRSAFNKRAFWMTAATCLLRTSSWRVSSSAKPPGLVATRITPSRFCWRFHMGAASMQFTCKGFANGINSGRISSEVLARNMPDFE